MVEPHTNLSSTTSTMPQSTLPLLYLAAGAASVSLLSLIYTSAKKPASKTIPSPLHNHPAHQPPSTTPPTAYPPHDFIPGARDLPTPYGSMRIYEFGSTDPSARKVLLVHGISTPCISLLGVAEGLAARGCRVMLFDLFGRGWSDAVADLPYDGRLYATQVLLAVTASPYAWIGSRDGDGGGGGGGGFSMVGYSLGGCVCADFASYFPHMVQDLVLIAPGGLLRMRQTSLRSRIVYSSLLPEWLVARLVTRRLRGTPVAKTPEGEGEEKAQKPGAAAAAEVTDGSSITPTARRKIDPQGAVEFALANHPGFIHAFMSSIRHAPIHDQQARWSKIGQRLTAQRAGMSEQARREGLRSGKVLLILGEKDEIILKDEVANDARAVLGEENVEVKVVMGAAHEVPMSKTEEVTESIWALWSKADAR